MIVGKIIANKACNDRFKVGKLHDTHAHIDILKIYHGCDLNFFLLSQLDGVQDILRLIATLIVHQPLHALFLSQTICYM